MPKLERLNVLVGSYDNPTYPLSSGISTKFLVDNTTYFGNQLESELGVLANMDFILVYTYEADGKNPELVLYKKRKQTLSVDMLIAADRFLL